MRQRDVLSSINGVLGENAEFGKAIAVSQAVIDTYAGATKALAQGGTLGLLELLPLLLLVWQTFKRYFQLMYQEQKGNPVVQVMECHLLAWCSSI
jgi:hypothetical protein